jgi:hypothetical protein
MATIGASQAARIVQCHGSWSAMQSINRPESESAREGTAAHWVAMQLIKGEGVNTGDIAPNGVAVTDEMIECGAMFAAEIASKIYGDHKPWLESTHAAPSIHPDNVARPDASWWDFTGDVFYVWSYKYGHTYVDVQENWQLINEAAALLDHVKPQKGYLDIKFELVVVQPRCFAARDKVRRWKVSHQDLLPYFDTLKHAYAAATGVDKPWCFTGNECRFCPVAVTCKTLQAASYDIAEWAAIVRQEIMTPDDLGNELTLFERCINLLEARVNGLRVEAEALCKDGVNVRGWQLVPTSGREQWNTKDQEIIELGRLSGVELTRQNLITPSQAIKAGIPREIVEMYSERKSGSKLAPFKLNGVFNNGN